MKELYQPKKGLGSLTLFLTGIFLVTLGIFALSVWSGQRGGQEFFDNLWLAFPLTFGAFCAIVGLFTGIVSIVKGERRKLVYIATLICAFVTWFVSAELIFPH